MEIDAIAKGLIATAAVQFKPQITTQELFKPLQQRLYNCLILDAEALKIDSRSVRASVYAMSLMLLANSWYPSMDKVSGETSSMETRIVHDVAAAVLQYLNVERLDTSRKAFVLSTLVRMMAELQFLVTKADLALIPQELSVSLLRSLVHYADGKTVAENATLRQLRFAHIMHVANKVDNIVFLQFLAQLADYFAEQIEAF